MPKGLIILKTIIHECRLCDDRNETVYYIINKYSKQAQKEYKSRHEWVGNIIHWKLCKKLKFHDTDKHKPKSVLENKVHKILCDFEMQTDHPNSSPNYQIISILIG